MHVTHYPYPVHFQVAINLATFVGKFSALHQLAFSDTLLNLPKGLKSPTLCTVCILHFFTGVAASEESGRYVNSKSSLYYTSHSHLP